MLLIQYKQKRNFSGKNKTPEPKPKISKTKKLIFVIHKHHASHLHWDLRLQRNKVLKSWAIPKEPPKVKNVKRLAIQVENHPLEYAKFQGEIKQGYGKGIVKIWDKGTYELKFWNSKKIEFVLHGKKLKGNYVLIKATYGSKPEKSWLWFKI